MLVKICRNIIYLLSNSYNQLKKILELSYFPKNHMVAIKLAKKRLLTAAAIYPASGYTIILEY